jgi:alcohol dehydrogenase class IV
MWYFRTPEIVFGEDALSHLDELEGQRAFIVTDSTLANLGFVDIVKKHLAAAGIESAVFAEVEPDPSLQTVRQGAQAMQEFAPDWVIGLGGGSSMDAAKAMWFLYEKPEADPAEINPFDRPGLRQKARLIAIPTTSGTGAEVTWYLVLTDLEARRKLALLNPEILPDIAIVDPSLVTELPPQVTADTGMDALVHAVEAYISTWRNDFSDGLCLRAIQLVFEYLPRAYVDGNDAEAREKMHNAGTIAGIAFGNSVTGLAHAMGHTLGAAWHIPHGRAVGLALPYVLEFTRKEAGERLAEMICFLGMEPVPVERAAYALADSIRELMREIGQPVTVMELGISADDFKDLLPELTEKTELDASALTNARIATTEEVERLYRYAFEGKAIDF